MNRTYGAIGNVTANPQLVEMAMAYSRSRVLCAAARLGVADALGNDERSIEDLGRVCGANGAALYRLLRTMASLGIVSEVSPGSFRLTPFGQPLRKDAPGSVWAAVVFWSDLLADSWSYLTDCVRTGETAFAIMKEQGRTSRWSADPEADAIFRAVMGTGPAENYASIAASWDFGKYDCVADLGGGGGALLEAVLLRYPRLKGMLVDRPESADAARPRFAASGLADRCAVLGGDLKEHVPAGADVYVLKHVLHGAVDAAAVELLKHCRAVIPADGRVLVIEFLLPDTVAEPDESLERRLMSDLNMMAVTGGKERSAAEWGALFERSGFVMERVVPVPDEDVSIVEASPRRDDSRGDIR